MKSLKTIIIVMLVMGFAQSAWSGEYTIFAPKQFVRGTGQPATETVNFASPIAGSGFTLKVQNGDAQGSNRVSSASIKLNGDQILGPAYLNQQTGAMQRMVSLGSSNAMSVNLASAPGSFLTITVTGEDNTPPQIAITNPIHGSATGAESIDVSGTVRDDTTVNIAVNGIPATVAWETFIAAGIPLAVGQNTITATATDLGGNISSFAITVIREIHPPDVVGMLKADVEAVLVTSKLIMGNVSSAYSDTVPAGYVVSQNPVTSAWIMPGTAIDLVVSNGPAVVSVPNVVGMTRSDAEAAVMATNLQTGAITTA